MAISIDMRGQSRKYVIERWLDAPGGKGTIG
jgi:hypothetical protein